MTPLHRTPHWVSLPVEKDTDCAGARETRHQEFVLSGYHDHIGIGYPVQISDVNLRDRQDFCERDFGEIDQTVRIRGRYGGAQGG
jgi:hypothetical protein